MDYFMQNLKCWLIQSKVGKSWSVDTFTFTIESVDKTITVPAGYF